MPDPHLADAGTEQDLAAIADEAAIQAREALLPGMLAGAILGDLEQLLEQARENVLEDQAATAATVAHLATAADALDRIRARADAETAGPTIAPDIARRAAAALLRCAEMLQRAPEVKGRFVYRDADPDLANPPWTDARIVPDGYEDLDPAALQVLAAGLHHGASE